MLKEELKIIKARAEEIVPEDELIKKIEKSHKTGKPLRIKYGIDPTGSDVHIGHLVPIRKMRDFQDAGHTGVIIIGDFTAQIGDPTGRDSSRPPLTKEMVHKNAERYMEQLFTVLDESKTEIRWQSEWFGDMSLVDVLNLLGKFTLAQFMAHDTFRERYEKGLPLGMHEIMYPVLQGYDSVAINSDVELGATEQKFNILVGRDMQRYFNMEQQVAMLFPILLGTDGVNKMSKSMNNYIAVFDTPKDKYGKVMSIPDNLILNYFRLAANFDELQLKQVQQELESGKNPKLIKQQLARTIVGIYHGTEAAKEAEQEFDNVFANKDIPTDIQTYPVSESPIWIIKLLTDSGLCVSNSEARRLVSQNAVSIDNEKMSDANAEIEITGEHIIKAGKRRFLKVVKA